MQIGEQIGWSESKVKQYSVILNLVTNILELAKRYQNGRVTDEVTNVTFDFTEGWFRNSGIYELLLTEKNLKKLHSLKPTKRILIV